MQSLAPVVFASVRPRKKWATVAEAIVDNAWVSHLQGPITLQIIEEVSMLYDRLELVQLS